MTERRRWLSLADVSVLALSVATMVSSHAAAQTSPAEVVVEVTGEVPGFAGQDQLARFLAEKMTGASPSWRFVATAASPSKPQNRVEWTVRTVKVVWPGGTSRGVRLATVSHTYLKCEVRLYLQDHYQMTMSGESGADDGPTNSGLAEMAANVARTLVASAADAKR
jgi:hypothetical protein